MPEFDDLIHRPMWTKIHEQIEADKASFDMCGWFKDEVEEAKCGTSACIMGWAVIFGGHNPQVFEDDPPGDEYHQAWMAGFDALGLEGQTGYSEPWTDGGDPDWDGFYLSNDQGKDVVRMVATEGLTPGEALVQVDND